jgi:hypothetical protein
MKKKLLTKIFSVFLLPIFIGLLIKLIAPTEVLQVVWVALKQVVAFFLIEFTLPIWAIILLVLAIPFLVVLVFILLPSRTSESYHSYVSDNLFGINWHWKYSYGHLYNEDIVPRCPECKTIMERSATSPFMADVTTLTCTHCGYERHFDLSLDALIGRVKKEIDRKIITEEYKNVKP